MIQSGVPPIANRSLLCVKGFIGAGGGGGGGWGECNGYSISECLGYRLGMDS